MSSERRYDAKQHPAAYWPFDESSGPFAEERRSGANDDIQFALRKGRYQEPVDPIRRRGMKGNSLSFDGYSTFLRREAASAPRPVDGITIACWVAPRTYGRSEGGRLSAIVSHHEKAGARGYLFGLYRDGSLSFQLGSNGSWHEAWSSPGAVPLWEWTFAAATYDKSSGRMALYVNGAEAAVRELGDAGEITAFAGEFLIGRNNDGAILAEAFALNLFNGLLDELMIFDRALSAEEIEAAYRADLAPHDGRIPFLPRDDFAEIRRQRTKDRHRPQYHLSPPAHWMNEPHAPLYFNGRYHLFYQYDPQGPFWNHIHWGHWVSDDLVRWRDLPPALAPGDSFGRDGIWSGSACLDERGNPALFYTAGDFSSFPTQTVGLARSAYPLDGDNDLVRWTKHPNPIVEQSKEHGLYGEFRDPFVWEEDGTWYMLVGTGTGAAGQGGTASVFTSSGDMTKWTYRGPLFISNYAKYPYLGVMWELPVLLSLPEQVDGAYRTSGKYILLICPWGEGAKVEVNYWIGEWDKEACRFRADHEEPGLIDVGDFHFTGPSGMIDPKTGRALLFTIAQGERTPEIDYDSGWAHGAGLPVSLYVRPDGTLGVEPIHELRQLRGRKVFEGIDELGRLNERLAAVRGDMLEIRVKFEGAEARRYGIAVRRSPGGEEETLLYYDREREWLAANREKSTLDPAERIGGIQGGSLRLQGEALELTIYVDKSMIECYASRIKSLTTRTYPSRTDAVGVALWADGPVERVALDIWEMTPAFQT